MLELRLKPSIAEKVVLVTGASSGIGEATAREFARCGASVILTARRKTRLDKLADEINRAGGRAISIPADLLDQEQITNLVAQTIKVFGKVDVLCNIAGWGHYDWIEELSAESLRKQYAVNVIGMAELIRQVVPFMKEQRNGVIINMSSYASRISVPPLTVYASTKAAIEALTDGLRRELLPWGIYVIRVHPSGVPNTEFNQKASRAGGIRFRSLPIGRVSKEKLAEIMVGLVERPRREVFISRLYDPGVFLNRHFPGVIDAFFKVWVRYKRKEDFEENPPLEGKEYRLKPSMLLLSAGVIFASLVLGGYLQKEHTFWTKRG